MMTIVGSITMPNLEDFFEEKPKRKPRAKKAKPPAVVKAVNRPKVKEKQSELAIARFVGTKTTEVPGYKKTWRKGGVTYKLGDEVYISSGADANVRCTLKAFLGSQIYVEGDDFPYGKFYFYTGLKVKKVK